MPEALSPSLLHALSAAKNLICARGLPSAHLLDLLPSPVLSRRTMTSMAVVNPPTTRVASTAIPGLSTEETRAAADRAFRRHTAPAETKRRGSGVAIVWFRNDLRLLDNEVLCRAWDASDALIPVYCLDPRMLGTTHYFKFPKTGEIRMRFLLECLVDLKKNLIGRGLNLLVRQGRPEDVLPELAKAFGAHTVFAQKETCSEELHVERRVCKGLQQVLLLQRAPSKSTAFTQLQLIWGSTMYHIDDLPFETGSLPDVYTQFRKSVEVKSRVRNCHKLPLNLGPPPKTGLDDVGGWGSIPSLEDLGMREKQTEKGFLFLGGETAALGRIEEYFWEKDLIKIYKEIRNGMLGPDYSTKLSPLLATGCLSARYIYQEVRRYENERIENDSTYWVLFELIWRDYFRFLSIKYGNSIFHLGGPRKVVSNWSQDHTLFEAWRDGRTGYPLIDASMKELSSTGFMSNRGRQIVCSFLVRDMGVDWRMGAEWFETCLLDYDPCSNYGNWTYGAGVGNDPREDRYFSIPKQAQTYDRDGEFVSYWLAELRRLPKERRNSPGSSYLKPIVPLKFQNINMRNNQEKRRQPGFRK